jgi:tartrate/fumarate subfamily iron-sulfur-dependent hydro-lyase alpha chain
MGHAAMNKLHVDPQAVEEAAKLLYIRALKVLPDDIKAGFRRLEASESDRTAKTILETMIRNISVAERTDNLLCQDTGIPIYNVLIGRDVDVDGFALKEAIRRGVERATREHPLRSSIVHPITRKNDHTSCGRGVPIINIDFSDRPRLLQLEMIPKGSGSENGSFLRMCVPADGVDALKAFVIDCIMESGGKVCPPTIVGVGVGGTSDLCMHLAKVAATRPLGSSCTDPEGAKLEKLLSAAANSLGIGPQGLGGDSTAFAVHVEVAATHITMNPVSVNIQCHSARRATATFTPDGLEIGF